MVARFARKESVGEFLWAGLLALVLVVFIWSRTAGLDLSLYHDEIFTVGRYAKMGPAEIFFGDYQPNNHVLFSLLAWLTWTVAGDGEIALRFWAVVPAVVATALIVGWVWRRWGGVAGSAVFVILATSPLIAQLSVLARGYGLTFLAVTLASIGAVEASEGEEPRRAIVLCAIGATVGTLTLPVFVLTATALGATLILTVEGARAFTLRAFSLGAVISIIWYGPLVDDLFATSSQEFGDVLDWHAFVTGPIELLLFPSFRALLPGVLSMPAGGHPTDPVWAWTTWMSVGGLFVAVGVGVMLRANADNLLVLTSPIVLTMGALVLADFFVEGRFVSYLLFPLSIVIAVGVSWVVKSVPGGAALMWLLSLSLVLSVLPAFSMMTRVPLEAYRSVGAYVSTLDGPIVTNSQRPSILGYYLPRSFDVVIGDDLQQELCFSSGPFVFVHHPVLSESIDTGCLRERNGIRQRFLQRDRGDWIDVWDVAASS